MGVGCGGGRSFAMADSNLSLSQHRLEGAFLVQRVLVVAAVLVLDGWTVAG